MLHFWEILSQVMTPKRKARWARRFGLHQDTIQAWTRPIESDAFPSGTGKQSCFDHAGFIIRDVHKDFPGEARELAEKFLAFVDELDRQAGIERADGGSRPALCVLQAENIREQADVIAVLAAAPDAPETWKRARAEIAEAKSKLGELDGCLARLLEAQKEKR